MENIDGKEVRCGVCNGTDVSVDVSHHHTWQYGTGEDAVELHATIPVWQCNNPNCVYQEGRFRHVNIELSDLPERILHQGGPEKRGFAWLDWEASDIITEVEKPFYRRKLIKNGERWEDWDLEMGRLIR